MFTPGSMNQLCVRQFDTDRRVVLTNERGSAFEPWTYFINIRIRL